MRQAQRGFTFIEILVVMGIIAVLAGLSVVAMNLFVTRGPILRTEALVKKVAAVANQWKARFERFPPSEPDKIHKAAGHEALPSMPNSINVGIESLYQAFYWPTFGGDPGLTDEEVANTDEDQFEKPSSQGKTVYEIADSWGNPLVYFVNTDYARADADPPSYVRADGIEVMPRPWRYADEDRGFAEPRGLQIFSMGEDGEPNTPDDIKSWE